MSTELSFPPFDNVRLATLSDLPRIAMVAAAGFYHSPTFQFQRPYYADFPDDTLSSYWTEYQSAIRNPADVVLVAEDVWDPDEGLGVYGALRGSSMYKFGSSPTADKVIVGVCSINLKPGSWRIGRFQTGNHVDSPTPATPFSTQNRDQCAMSLELYGAATAPAKAKYLAGRMRLSTLAVHPAYWRRGHATRLVSWCIRLADKDDVPVGISAAPMGAAVAAKAGFEEQETVRIKRSTAQESVSQFGVPNVGDVELWVAIRQPSRSPSDTSTTCSDSPTGESL
ncbi:uncharacterized protein BDR25DRAFT_271082 [Lindgomyces ingoldianus]|uniref:Uncharacterized protein n=1 Tax=Lindgomyces ingoldianus TaxID=673940 RepID=A0ACB6QCW6_9PLEO|nr:uncharacterized protein BDR25DRAFT_271082 [Lindgomyces ingoldianus]KAF2464864.1 hypothetical protein BDR25DRAFT_271082 [Lindgomyces ingoldianus]